ncbi:hypothetical protein [Pseudolactococcus insecticola]|uniref:Helix-turn-helix type 11 domain-containing protein n=1 Tax=Pseudolactococcus insecticola TaxID=2709158 RepID=A0A6A0BAF8_9LACT|nr:hypothetical protein [Lactococcus insecticola]GFH41438.1 hypothetical protein Hs20B_18360 [Lactococcus insecticola]
MKFKELPKTDQDIIMALSEHKGIERTIKANMLAKSVRLELRALQSRIERLQKQGCAIGSIDGQGYFIPLNEDERRAGIIKKQRTGITITEAVNGYTMAPLEWLDELLDE